MASFSMGSSQPIIGVLGEYDALAGLSQEAGSCEEIPRNPGGNGHGCGHNLLGVSSAGASISLRYFMEEENIDGTIRFYGCPAEEGGSGKTYMVREGLFDDVDVVLSWHPGDENSVSEGSTLANIQSNYRFKGMSSHAAISPHLGRSALDAVELMHQGMNYLREHIIPDARVHYAVTNTGGHSPNVVQGEAEVVYLIRAPHVKDAEDIYERINNIAKGAALMTGTEVEITFDKACSNIVPNRALYTLMHEVLREIDLPEYTEAEIAFARKISRTLNVSTDEAEVTSDLNPLTFDESNYSVSTDVGDVSWVVPTVQCSTTCFAKGTPFHSWQMVSQSNTSLAHKGMLHASKVLGATALHLFRNKQIITEARGEWQERLKKDTYTSPIPAHIHPQK